VKQNRKKHHHPEHRPYDERARDGDPVEERVQQQPDQRARPGDGFHSMRLFAEVKVRRDRVLGQVHRQVAGEHQPRRRRSAAQKGFGQDLGNRHRQHEPRPECHRMLDHEQARLGAPQAHAKRHPQMWRVAPKGLVDPGMPVVE